MKYSKLLFVLTIYILFNFLNISLLFSQDDREQSIGTAFEMRLVNTLMKGEVRSKVTNQIVTNADITVKEASSQTIINQTKVDANGKYDVDIPKGVDVEIIAQAPEYFYDSYKLKIGIEDTSVTVVHNFFLPSELQLRLNFPTNKFDKPYPFVLDNDGNETTQTWELAVNEVSDDILKYVASVEKIIITGHTDEDGTNQANMTLGQNRADFLRDELQKRGVPETIIETASKGEEELIAKRDNEDPKVWKKRCRRVVLSKEIKK